METLTYRSPRLVALFLLVAITAGLSAFMALGRQEDPTITNIFAVIKTPYPGADPERVEALVSRPLEESLRRIPEINIIESVSATGISILNVELVETVDPGIIEQIWSEVRDKLEEARPGLPAGALPPEMETDNLGAYAALAALKPSAGTPPAVLARYGDALAEQLRNIPGVKVAETFGLPEEEVLVRLDPGRAAALGLTADQIAAAIGAADGKVQAGQLVGAGGDFLFDVTGDIEALARLRDVIVAESGQGAFTRLGDIAEITRTARAPARSIAWIDGREAVLVAVMAGDGLQIDTWMSRVQAELEDFRATLPHGLELDQIFDQSQYTAERLWDVALNMAIGVALVILVLLVTLGLRAALIVAMVLPLVTLATLTSMNLIGLPIHQMSVTGLVVALGLLVDAAIVMTDEVRQRIGRGRTREEAVGRSVKRLAAPLFASTITTALSFVPMILLPGPAGDFVGSIAIAVVLMLGWSFIVAVAITPALAGWLLLDAGQGGGLKAGFVGRLFRASLRLSTEHPVKSLGFALVLPVMGFLSMPTLKAQFFPGVDRDQFHIEVELAPGTGIARTRALTERLDAALRGKEGIRQVAWVIGESAPAFYYNIIGSRENAPGFAQALVTTQSPEATAALLTPLQAELTARFPEARILVRGLVQGPPVDAPVELRFAGPDIGVLRALGEEARAVLLAEPGVEIVRASYEGGAPKLRVDLDEAEVELRGLSLGQVARQLEAGLQGAVAGTLVEAGEELPIRVRLGDGAGDTRGDLSRIGGLPILPPDARGQALAGDMPGIPLAALADISLEPSASAITRRNGVRTNTVQAFLRPEILPEEALASALAALEASGFAMPAGYALELGGDSDARADVLRNLLASVGLIVTLSIATVVVTFNSFRLTGITFVVAGLSAGLSILALAVFQYPFGITAIIGVIGSIGVSINAAIIILTGLQAAEETGERMADVVMGSSRHILSTTLTTTGGFLPLILGGGGFWPPFAMSIAGGVLLSTVVSFYFTPAAYALVRRRAKQPKAGKVKDVPVLYPSLAAE